MFTKTIISKNNSKIKITLDLMDDAPDAETLRIIKSLQEFVNNFYDENDFETFMESFTKDWNEERVH